MEEYKDICYFEVTTKSGEVLTSPLFIPTADYGVAEWENELTEKGFALKTEIFTDDNGNPFSVIRKLAIASVKCCKLL